MYVLSVVILARAVSSWSKLIFANMSAVTAIPAPKTDAELKVFYHRKWKAVQAEIVSINTARNEHIERSNNQLTELNKAIKYLL